MRSVVITRQGGPEVLQVQEKPDPVAGAGQVRIEVAAAGINFADVMARMGLYPDAPPTPCVVGYEVAGTVVEVSAGVEGVEAGARVLAGTKFGGYSSEVVVPAGDLVVLPQGMSFEQGAAVPVNYATAWAALIGYGNIQPGERVLIHSAGGGVGIAATQLARHAGAEIWGTASASKHDRIRELGVEHPLDYNRAGWEKGLPPFDVVLDALGGASFRRSYKMMRPGGRLVMFGVSTFVSGQKRNLLSAARAVLSTPIHHPLKLMTDSKAVIGLNMLTLWKDRDELGPWIGPLVPLLADGTIQPVVSDVFSFAEAGAAQNVITERRNVGKVVLVP